MSIPKYGCKKGLNDHNSPRLCGIGYDMESTTKNYDTSVILPYCYSFLEAGRRPEFMSQSQRTLIAHSTVGSMGFRFSWFFLPLKSQRNNIQGPRRVSSQLRKPKLGELTYFIIGNKESIHVLCSHVRQPNICVFRISEGRGALENVFEEITAKKLYLMKTIHSQNQRAQ